MLVGYARVSTQDQDLALQLDALKAADCEKLFTEKAFGAQRERPQLKAALEYMRPGDTLVVWKLDRLARSTKQLIETVEGLGAQEMGFKSLTEALDTTTAGGKLISHLFASLVEFERAVLRERTRAGLMAAFRRGLVTTLPLFFPSRSYTSGIVPHSAYCRQVEGDVEVMMIIRRACSRIVSHPDPPAILVPVLLLR